MALNNVTSHFPTMLEPITSIQPVSYPVFQLSMIERLSAEATFRTPAHTAKM